MKKVLLVVDMQNDFIDGSLGTDEARSMLDGAVDKVRSYIDAGVDVVFTMDTHGEDYLNTQEGRKLPVCHCIAGTEGWEMPAELRKLADDSSSVIMEKDTFGNIEVADYLASEGYDEIEIIGLCTDICVISNALIIRSRMPEASVRLDASCCAGVTPGSHEAALAAMRMCQVEVV